MYLQQIYGECDRKGVALPPIQICSSVVSQYHNGLFQKKPNRGGLRTYLFETPPGFFRIFTLPLEIPDKTRLHSKKLHKTGNSTLFLISSRKIHLLFLQYPWKFHILNSPPSPVFFFWNSLTENKTYDNDRAHKNDANTIS